MCRTACVLIFFQTNHTESVHDIVLAKLKRRIDKFRVGHPLDKSIDMGALVDESQYTTIKSFVDAAVQEGADVYVARTPVRKKIITGLYI